MGPEKKVPKLIHQVASADLYKGPLQEEWPITAAGNRAHFRAGGAVRERDVQVELGPIAFWLRSWQGTPFLAGGSPPIPR